MVHIYNGILVVQSLSHVRVFATPWTAVCQSRQEYWSGLPSPSTGDLPDPGIEPVSPALQADYLQTEPRGNPDITDTLNQKKWHK